MAPSKTKKGPVTPLDPKVPHNRAFPGAKLKPFPEKASGATRFAAWNITSIKSAHAKGFEHYIAAEDADVLILAETKVVEDPELDAFARYPYRYWGADPKKGYAGTGVLSKIKPVSVEIGLSTFDPISETTGRYVQLEFDSVYVIGTYVPNAGNELKFMDRKQKWNEAFGRKLRELEVRKPVIWGGDINCCRTADDLRNPDTNYNKSAGYTQAEIDGLVDLAEPEGKVRLVDAWRTLHPATVGQYTYYSYRFQCREKGIGWRLDTFYVSAELKPHIKACDIRSECYGCSDHVPVVLDVVLGK